MMINDITQQVGRHKKRKRIGRGPGSGTGKTAGRGHKGAGSRAGNSKRANFEGGQMQFFKRIPKRGFSNANFRKVFVAINLKAIDARFDDGAEVNPEMLVKVGLLPDTKTPVKILGEGELSKKLSVTVATYSKSAIEKIEKAGGTATATLVKPDPTAKKAKMTKKK